MGAPSPPQASAVAPPPSPLVHAMSGAVGAVVAMALLYPLDQVRAILQVRCGGLDIRHQRRHIFHAKQPPPLPPLEYPVLWASLSRILSFKRVPQLEWAKNQRDSFDAAEFCKLPPRTHMRPLGREIQWHGRPYQNLVLCMLVF